MADMQIAVGLGREARVKASAVLAGLEVGIYFLLNKVEASGFV